MNETESNPSNGSFFKRYSFGVVAKNKPLDSHEIEVVPMEVTPSLSGELTDNATNYDAGGKNADGGAFNVSLPTTASVKATWWPGNDTNRISSPDVRRGEIVTLFRMADSDEFWWETAKRDKEGKLRRLETVIHSYSNNSQEDVANDANSTYYTEVSTHKKHVTLHTSKNDGEPFAYDIQINAKDGVVIIQDDDDNYIFMDSKNRRIKMHNADNSLIDLNRKDILIEAVDSVTINTKVYKLNASTSNSIKSPTNSTIGDTQLIKATTTNDGFLTVTRLTTMNGGFFAQDTAGDSGGGDVGVVIGKVRFRDDVTMEANLHVQGNTTMDGKLDVTGKITTPVDISAPNV